MTMGKQEKLLRRLQSRPNDFTWSELGTLLRRFGYREVKGQGSRRKFIHDSAPQIILHEPHPSNLVKRYPLVLVIDKLREGGFI